jgi:hypothetical protein
VFLELYCYISRDSFAAGVLPVDMKFEIAQVVRIGRMSFRLDVEVRIVFLIRKARQPKHSGGVRGCLQARGDTGKVLITLDLSSQPVIHSIAALA